MIPAKLDSLFFRLMLAQTVLVSCSLLIFGGLLLVQHNELIAPQYAEHLAPGIIAMAHTPGMQMSQADRLDSVIVRHDALPRGLKLRIIAFPAMTVFVDELAKHGIFVKDAWLRYENAHFAMWLLVQVPSDAPVWLSGSVPLGVLPVWASRLSVGLACLGVVIGLMSWNFARRVTNPLAQLRKRMQAHANSGVQPNTPMQSMQNSKAPPELVAIDKAYHLLAERLQRNERERALLLAGVSHDLRSPLSRIRLAAEMLPETPDNTAGVASITRNVDTADRLTASFLEFIRASTVPLNETVDLARVLQHVLTGFEKPARELRAKAPNRLLLEHAHSLLVERLIANLVDNAFKHGGAPVEVELVEKDGWASLTVSDAGPGLPHDGAGQLMDAFARGDASRGLPGFGLGLAIVQQIVVRMNGELLFGPRGTRQQVAVRLPLKRLE
jgi:two-component system, OmpR family, osmolarity sensor histidine kinase EnvZ